MESDNERIKRLITETLTLLCKNSIAYTEKLRIEGLVGISVDSKDMLFVHISKEYDLSEPDISKVQHNTLPLFDDNQDEAEEQITEMSKLFSSDDERVEQYPEKDALCEPLPLVIQPDMETEHSASEYESTVVKEFEIKDASIHKPTTSIQTENVYQKSEKKPIRVYTGKPVGQKSSTNLRHVQRESTNNGQRQRNPVHDSQIDLDSKAIQMQATASKLGVRRTRRQYFSDSSIDQSRSKKKTREDDMWEYSSDGQSMSKKLRSELTDESGQLLGDLDSTPWSTSSELIPVTVFSNIKSHPESICSSNSSTSNKDERDIDMNSSRTEAKSSTNELVRTRILDSESLKACLMFPPTNRPWTSDQVDPSLLSKVQQRRFRNRLAARRCRDRKKQEYAQVLLANQEMQVRLQQLEKKSTVQGKTSVKSQRRYVKEDT